MKIWIAALSGLLLGVLSASPFYPPSQVHANGNLRLHVNEVPKGNYFDVQGSQVVGFSCISIPGQSRCFVATVE
ncbi:MAG: hypothetical protein LAO56_08040 [Acidobacteriia bacterium]|nr:hypothetical protein [Terriglobia bacterium]